MAKRAPRAASTAKTLRHETRVGAPKATASLAPERTRVGAPAKGRIQLMASERAPPPRVVARASARIGSVGLTPLAKGTIGLGVAGMAYAAMTRAAEAGETQNQQAIAGAAAGGTTAARTLGIAYGLVKAEQALVHAAPSLAVHGARALVTTAKFAVPALGLGLAAYGAYRGYQQAGIKGAAVGSLTQGFVPKSMFTSYEAANHHYQNSHLSGHAAAPAPSGGTGIAVPVSAYSRDGIPVSGYVRTLTTSR